jgi:hypothetical protein
MRSVRAFPVSSWVDNGDLTPSSVKGYESDTLKVTKGIPGSIYSTVVLSSPNEIRQLAPVIRRLTLGQPDSMHQPDFFLSSASEQWTPRVVSIQRNDETIGIVYTRERKIAGLPAALIFADGSLTGMWIGDRDQQDVFRVALERLIAYRSVQGIRLRVLAGSAELPAIRSIVAFDRLDAHFRRIKPHACLNLPRSYEDFLKGLSYKTRRHFRYYRRRSHKRGNQYIDQLSTGELHSAAWELSTKSRVQVPSWALRRMLKMVAAIDRPFHVGLKDRHGKWLSIAGGCHRSDSAVMFFQLNNDLEFEHDSISLVLRACLVEGLIRRETKELIFRGGVGPPLSRYASPVRAIEVHLDKRTSAWRIARLLLAKIGPWVPKRLVEKARSIAAF